MVPFSETMETLSNMALSFGTYFKELHAIKSINKTGNVRIMLLRIN